MRKSKWGQAGHASGDLGGQVLGLLAEKGSEPFTAANLLLPGPWRLTFTCQEDAKAVLFGENKRSYQSKSTGRFCG